MISRKNQILFTISALVTLGLICYFSPIQQAQAYHDFAEQRHFLGIPNIGDVLSNLAFVLVGVKLLWNTRSDKSGEVTELYPAQQKLFNYFCYGCIALGLGSTYYHWAPTDMSLAWDRVTMVMGFSVIFYDSCVRYSVVGEKNALQRCLIVSAFFMGTVLFWIIFHRLEPYVFVQFFTMFTLVVLVWENWGEVDGMHLLLMFILYACAKYFESVDKGFFEFSGQLISGHTMKHLAYALALYHFGAGMMPSKK